MLYEETLELGLAIHLIPDVGSITPEILRKLVEGLR